MLSPRLGRLINEKNKILPFSQRYIHIIQSGFLMNAASSMIMPFLSRDFKEHVSRTKNSTPGYQGTVWFILIVCTYMEKRTNVE